MPDLATEIFSGAGADYAKLADAANAAGSEQPAVETNTEPQQGVESTETQGKEGQPATPGDETNKEADGETPEAKEATQGDKGENKSTAKVREWGEGWKQSAEAHEKRIKEEFEPLLTKINDKFGGNEGLEFAAEIFEALTDEDNFDPDNAIEFLSENVPQVAEKLVNHITKQVIDRATSTALKRTFGRDLSADEVGVINQFLAAGQTAPDKFEKFFQTEDIPEELRYDAQGNELPPAVLAHMRNLQSQVSKTTSEIKAINDRIQAGEQNAITEKAQTAIEQYVVTNNLGPIDAQIEKLGLHQAFDGETPELAAQRQWCAKAIGYIALGIAGEDESFQDMYRTALKAVGNAAAHTKPGRVAGIKTADYSRRIQAKMGEFAEQASEIFSPLLKTFADARAAQVAKTKTTREEITTSAGADTNKQEKDPNRDPFDKTDIQREVDDIRRRGAGR